MFPSVNMLIFDFIYDLNLKKKDPTLSNVSKCTICIFTNILSKFSKNCMNIKHFCI